MGFNRYWCRVGDSNVAECAGLYFEIAYSKLTLTCTYHRYKRTAIKCRTLYVVSFAFLDLYIQITVTEQTITVTQQTVTYC